MVVESHNANVYGDHGNGLLIASNSLNRYLEVICTRGLKTQSSGMLPSLPGTLRDLGKEVRCAWQRVTHMGNWSGIWVK